MFKLKKDRLLLLQALREMVKESMNVNPLIEEDASVFLTELTDKRNMRRLKIIRRELDKWIGEMVVEQRLRREEQLFNAAKRREANEAYAAHCNADQ